VTYFQGDYLAICNKNIQKTCSFYRQGRSYLDHDTAVAIKLDILHSI